MTESDGGGVRAGLSANGVAIPLLGVDVRGEVLAGHTRILVRQRYRNEEARSIEAVYTFPLPSRAVVTSFAVTMNGRRLLGEVHAREGAVETYEEALSRGHGAALLEQERPNVFTVNVGNLLPNEETTIEIEYVQPLIADEGAIRWVLPTLVAPRYVPPGVPDAERISPPIGHTTYGLTLDVVFDLGVAIDVLSPSHAIAVERQDGKQRVTLAQPHVRLDRDVVLLAVPVSSDGVVPIAAVITHAEIGKPGIFALTLVPDFGRRKNAKRVPNDLVFVLDRSGSMGGPSMREARTALRLCLRQLEEGDRFAILAFDDHVEAFAPRLVPFTEATLQRADSWLQTIDARGGTQLLRPLIDAAALAPDGVIVLLTDGQVGNEDEILRAFLAARGSARVYAFGIGTNVSDVLLDTLAYETGGALEAIHPNERVDEKVVAQFARATAARVTDLSIAIRGVETFEIAPAKPIALVDGEPFSVLGKFEHTAVGAIELRGKIDGERFYFEVPIDLTDACERPFVEKLWARARIEDLQRAGAKKDRIVKLAIDQGISSKYTSFVVVEMRTGDRRVNEPVPTRIVAVDRPADWDSFQHRFATTRCGTTATFTGITSCRRPMQTIGAPSPDGAALQEVKLDPTQERLARQSASGLWEGDDPLEATIAALVFCVRENIDAAHPVHGAQIRKAIDALLAHLEASPPEAALLELALGVAWALTTGPRTRRTIEDIARKRGVRLGALAC